MVDSDTHSFPLPLTPLQQFLSGHDACLEGRIWAGAKTLTEAWTSCPESDWMKWFLERIVYQHVYDTDQEFKYCCAGCWLEEQGFPDLSDASADTIREYISINILRQLFAKELNNV